MVAQTSRLNAVNAGLKFWSVMALMLLCISAHSPFAGLFLTLAMMFLTVCVGGLSLQQYLRMLTLPLSFLLLGALALLFELSPQPDGILSIPLPRAWLVITPATQAQTTLVMARALGAVSCLYLLSLTTPMSGLIGVLRRARCPGVVIELMYLIYRYIFILLNMFHTMRSAAQSRLGYSGYRAAIRTTGGVYSALLARSYRQAGVNFDAMLSRCYSDRIQFLESEKAVSGAHIVFAALLIAITALLRFI